MERHLKHGIYKGMIQYILKSTNFTLKDIADLSNTPMSSIRDIYCLDLYPAGFKSEISLLKLYQTILEINKSRSA